MEEPSTQGSHAPAVEQCTDQAKAAKRKPFSRAAVASAVLGAAFFTGLGLVALPLGALGLVRTRGNKLRGRSAAKWGFGLGAFSLFVNLSGCPGVLFPPPVCQEDRAFSQFLDDIGGSRYERLNGEITVANTDSLSPAELKRWVDALNDQYGRGHMLWPAVKTILADGGRIYWVRFEKKGVRSVEIYCNDSGDGWVAFFPDDAPRPGDLRFSDEYAEDAEVRDFLDERMAEQHGE